MKNKFAIVMIHGLLGSLDFFSPSNRLPDFDVYAPHLIGYGGLDNRDDTENLSLQDQVNFVKELVAHDIQEPCWILGHSVGGAIAMMFAAQNPELVAGIINVEGNFTLNDAFWCKKVAQLNAGEWERDYQTMRAEPEKWLLDGGIDSTPERLAWAKQILDYQPASTAQAVAKAVVRDTASPDYAQTVQQVAKQQTTIYLIAGERSKDEWDVSPQVRSAAVQFIVQPNTGHMMMLEAPEEFCEIVRNIILQKVVRD